MATYALEEFSCSLLMLTSICASSLFAHSLLDSRKVGFVGSIPTEIANLSDLQSLDMAGAYTMTGKNFCRSHLLSTNACNLTFLR